MSGPTNGSVHVHPISDAVVLLEIDNPPMNPLGVEMRQTFMDALDQVERLTTVMELVAARV